MGYLRDEAYAFLCAEAVRQQLADLEREKSTLESSRPPFGGFLVGKGKREAFEYSVRAAVDNEKSLRARLETIESIEGQIRSVLGPELAERLAAISPEFCRFPQIVARLYDWEQSFGRLPELLLAFARDARSVRLLAAGAGATRRACLPELAVLRDTALRLERQFNELLIIGEAAREMTPAGAEADLALPVLPDFRLAEWVGNLAAAPLPQLFADLSRIESVVRTFLAHGAEAALAGLATTREACARHERLFLDHHWDQLREHARANYVEEADFDVVLEYLTQRYIKADLDRQQNNLVHDPFAAER